MSTREKNTHYYKAALKSFLQHPRHGNPSGLFGTSETCLEDLETFGVGVSAARQKFGRKCDAESNEQKVKVNPQELTSKSASVRSLKVEPLVDVGENDVVRMSETIDGRESEDSKTDSKVLQVDKESHNSPVIDLPSRKIILAATADMITGVSVVDRRDGINEDVLNSSDCDSDDALVIDVSANFESEDGDGSGVNSSCVTRSGVAGHTRVESASDGNVEMLHGVSELKNGTEGNSKSAKEVVGSEMKVSVQIETRVDVNESDKKDQNSVCSEVKDNIDELKEGVESEEIVDVGITTRSLRRAMVETMTRSDDNDSDVSGTRRRSLRCKTRASDDAPCLNAVTSTVATPVRRSLRSAVKGSPVGESDIGKKPVGIQRRSDMSSKKDCEKNDTGSFEPKRGRMQRSVTDVPADVGTRHTTLPKQVSACEDKDASTQKRRSIRLIARTINLTAATDASNTGSLTTGTRKRRSEPLDTSRSVEYISEISGPETTPLLKVELPSEASASENRTTCDDAGFLNVKDESSLPTSSSETDGVMTTSQTAGSSRVTGDNRTDDSGSCLARSGHGDNDTDFTNVSKNGDSSNAASGSQSTVIACDKNFTNQVVGGNDSMKNAVALESSNSSEVNRVMHTDDTPICSSNIDNRDIDGTQTQNTAIERTICGDDPGDISVEVGGQTGDKEGDATCVDNGSTGSMPSRSRAQERTGATDTNIASCNRGRMTGGFVHTVGGGVS